MVGLGVCYDARPTRKRVPGTEVKRKCTQRAQILTVGSADPLDGGRCRGASSANRMPDLPMMTIRPASWQVRLDAPGRLRERRFPISDFRSDISDRNSLCPLYCKRSKFARPARFLFILTRGARFEVPRLALLAAQPRSGTTRSPRATPLVVLHISHRTPSTLCGW